jgi:predicted nucleotidyltransferase component of viral defense system
MIEARTVQSIATRDQTTTLNVIREYCQHLLLSAWSRQREAERVLLKGGTALRILYGSPRFSEDLDFSGFGIRQPGIEGLLMEALSAIERVGLELTIEEAKATSGGYLGIIRSRVLGTDVRMQLEVSLRHARAIRPSMTLVTSDLVPAYTLVHLPQELLVEEKLQALLERGKPRDWYDLYFMLRKGLLVLRRRRVLRQVAVKLTRVEPQTFKELKVFLPTHQHRIVADFREMLDREIRRWLT